MNMQIAVSGGEEDLFNRRIRLFVENDCRLYEKQGFGQPYVAYSPNYGGLTEQVYMESIRVMIM